MMLEWIESITLMMRKLGELLSCLSSTEKKGPDFTKALIRNIAPVTGFLINTEKVVVPVK